MLFPWALVSLVLSCGCHAALRNVTIDDSNPDPETGKSILYEPAGGWNDGKNCNGCTAHPEESGLFDSTWHDSTFNPLPGSNDFPNQTLSASATFSGTAVYVQCVLARTTSSPSGYSDMSFFIDGNLVGTFVKPAPGTTGYDYDVTVYYNNSLKPGDHTIRIQNGHVDGIKSLIILDRIIYTTGTPDATSSSASPSASSSSGHSSTPVGTIAGATVGGVVGLVAVLLAIFFFLRYRKQQQRGSPDGKPDILAPATNGSQTTPFPHGPPSSNGSGQPFMSVLHANPSLNHVNSSSNLYSIPVTSGSFAAGPAANNTSYNNIAPNRREPTSPGSSSYDPYGGYQASQTGQSQSSQGPPSSTGAGYGTGMGYTTSGGTKADYHPQMVAHNRDLSSSGGGSSAAGDAPPAYEGHRPAIAVPVGKR